MRSRPADPSVATADADDGPAFARRTCLDRTAGGSHGVPARLTRPQAAGRRLAEWPSAWRPHLVPVTAWAIILSCSLLPTVFAREILNGDLTLDQRAAATAVVVSVCLALSVLSTRLRVLRPLLAILLTLAVSQWLVFELADRVEAIRSLAASDPGAALRLTGRADRRGRRFATSWGEVPRGSSGREAGPGHTVRPP